MVVRSIDSRPRALVTGGAGFIGSHLCEALLSSGYEVYVIDDLSTGRGENVAHLLGRPDFHLIVESVMNEGVMNGLVGRCDVVWHLAAAVGVRLVHDQPVRTLVTNVRGTEVVLELCDRFHRPVLVASTSEVYGDHRSMAPLSESDQRIYGATTINRWGYAASKALDEFLALAYHQERGLDVVVARLFNTVGPRQVGHYGMVIPSFVERALVGETLQVYGDGSQTRCFCHVDDTVRALIGLLGHEGAAGEIFNIGNDQPISILELAQQIIAHVGSPSEIRHVSYEEAFGAGFEDMRHRVPDVAKIADAIGWRPEHDLATILSDVTASARQRAERAVPAG